MTPEAKARQNIDALLVAAGWHVCNVLDANIHAATGVAIREFPLNSGFGFADSLLYVNGKACGVIEAKKEGATPPWRRGAVWPLRPRPARLFACLPVCLFACLPVCLFATMAAPLAVYF